MFKKVLLVLFGIVLALLFIEGLFRFSSFLLDVYRNYKIKQSFETKDKIIVTCIGESMTEKQYPKYLDLMLKKTGINNVKVIDEGVGAVDSNYLMNKLENKILKTYKPDIIIAMMGLMDENVNFKKIKIFPSKLFAFFAFCKLFNIDILDEGEKERSIYSIDPFLNEKYKSAMSYYKKQKYDNCLKILFTLDYPSPIQKNVKYEIIKILLLSGKKKEAREYVLKNLEEDIMFSLYQSIKTAERTNSIEILKKLFPINDEQLFKKIVLNSLDNIYTIKELMKRFELKSELNKLESIINNISNNDIVFYNNKANPFSNTAIKNYKKLAALCERNNIQLIVMQYPTLSILPYKIYLRDFKNIIFVSNEENFKYALKNNMYFDIFKDSFAGKFGHCTEYGNKLIGRIQVANATETGKK